MYGSRVEATPPFWLHSASHLLVPLLHGFGLLLEGQAQRLCSVPQPGLQAVQGLSSGSLAAPLFPPPRQIQAEGAV